MSDGPGWTERAVEFGHGPSLRGIVTSSTSASGTESTFLILLNAGVIHRVGPNRLSVRLARELAPDLLPSLRFDLAGLGDSPPRTDTTSIDDSIALDVAEAMDYLATAYGATRFVTLGLCSGGREAFRAAYRDPRVRGAVMIDPYAYPTWRFVARHILPRLFRLRSWQTALRLDGRVRRQPQGGLRDRGGHSEPAINLDVCGLPERPTRSQMRSALDQVMSRGTELFFIHTAGIRDHYNYGGQLRDAFPRQFEHPRLHYQYMPEADHTFKSEDARRQLIGHVSQWLTDVGLIRTPARTSVEAG